MAQATDVAKYICAQAGAMTAVKLQKLVYYCQAWSLVWDEEPLFEEEIQAWANGPVVPELYQVHRGLFKVDESTFESGNVEALTENQRDSIDRVLEALQDKSGQWLSELSHGELPWQEARGGVPPMERGGAVISLAVMHEYYSGLFGDESDRVRSGSGEFCYSVSQVGVVESLVVTEKCPRVLTKIRSPKLARNLLKYANTWQGDDLEECLELVRATRSITQF